MTTFQIILLEEAKMFLQDIPKQAQKKVLYNIWRVAGGRRTKNSLRNWRILIFGNSEHYTTASLIDYSLFGTLVKTHWLWQHME